MGMAMPALTPQNKVAEQRDIIAGMDAAATGRAHGAGSNNGFSQGQTVDTYV